MICERCNGAGELFFYIDPYTCETLEVDKDDYAILSRELKPH
jgi:hypothetical protein